MGEHKLKIKSISISEDRKKVFLETDGLKAGHVVYIHITDGLISAPGNSIWSTEAWYTLNELSAEMGKVLPSGEKFEANTLSNLEA